MKRAALCLVTVTVLAGILPSSAGARTRLKVTEAQETKFPDRAYVLTLPSARTLSSKDIEVTENGTQVDEVRLASGAVSTIVLAIDTSESMHGAAIRRAMAAARELVRQRDPEQRIGVVFFSRESRVILEPTSDAAAIAAALAATPPLTKGTQIYDAALTSLDVLRRAKARGGSVVMLSDGADAGSSATSSEVHEGVATARARLFLIGLRSPSFSATSLKSLKDRRSSYIEARSTADLAPIFRRLGRQLANEFLLTYRSPSPLETLVAVAVKVRGVTEVATVAYLSPGFPVPPGIPKKLDSPWHKRGTPLVVAVLIALLLGVAVLMVARPARQTAVRRVAEFTATSGAELVEVVPKASSRPPLAGRLERWAPWSAFTLDVELSRLRYAPMRVVAVTLGVALTGGIGFGVIAGRGVTGGVILVLTPVLVRYAIAYRATKTRRRFEDQLPDNLQVLASALRAGQSFVGALSVMAKDAPEPSGREYRRVVRDESLGVPLESSLQVVADRMKCEDVIYIGLIATLQRETGGNTAEVLDKVVETMRERGKIRRLVRTLTAQGRLGGWIVTALPVAMIVFLNIFSPHYLDPMLDKTIGIVILVIGGLMVATGAYAIRRIVDIKV